MNNQISIYNGYRFPVAVISYAVWLYHRFSMSYREAEEILAVRGVKVCWQYVKYLCFFHHFFRPRSTAISFLSSNMKHTMLIPLHDTLPGWKGGYGRCHTALKVCSVLNR